MNSTSPINEQLDIKRGIEKEHLRTTAAGEIAATGHPQALGAALTHACITTDFSESLIELVTPPLSSIDALCASLQEIESVVYQNIGEELLWPASMPMWLTR